MLLVGRQEGHPACKKWVVICWHGYLSGARCRLAYAQLMPLPLTVSCFSKIQISFTFLVPAHPGSPGKRAVKRVCVCVCVLLLLLICVLCSLCTWGSWDWYFGHVISFQLKLCICIISGGCCCLHPNPAVIHTVHVSASVTCRVLAASAIRWCRVFFDESRSWFVSNWCVHYSCQEQWYVLVIFLCSSTLSPKKWHWCQTL